MTEPKNEAQRRYDHNASVVYVDERGVRHAALVTAWWSKAAQGASGNPGPCDGEPACNVAYVSKNPDNKAVLGRDLEHAGTIPHRSKQTVAAGYWCWPDEADAGMVARAPKVTDGFVSAALFEVLERRWPSSHGTSGRKVELTVGYDGAPHELHYEPTNARFSFYDPKEALRFVAHCLDLVAAEDDRRAAVKMAEAKLHRKHADEARCAADGLLKDRLEPVEPSAFELAAAVRAAGLAGG